MQQTQHIVTLFGASGFVGRYVVKELARLGYRLRVIVRDTPAATFLTTQGEVGQIMPIYGDITRPGSWQKAVEESDAVINLVGVLYEKGAQNFAALHAQAPEKLAQAASKSGVSRFLHMSALGVDKAVSSKYAKTKCMGEKAVMAAFPEATIFRPSVIFGAEDNFYNQFACMSRISPFLPLIAGGKTKFQPVYVADVARAFAVALSDPRTAGRCYELGGPAILSFEEILRSIRTMVRRDPYLLTIPGGMAALAASLLQWLPHPPLTRDQVELLKYDNIVDQHAAGFEELGIQPAHPDAIVPTYLSRFVSQTANL